jgi:acetyl-CoA carboxylase carboxyl transferase subunit beta
MVYKVAIAVRCSFRLLAATMGSVVGERINARDRIPDRAHRAAVIIVVSLRGRAHVRRHAQPHADGRRPACPLALHAESETSLPLHPHQSRPTAGVMASFASLGDVIIAEPKAMVGFAVPRVYQGDNRTRICRKRFQTAENKLSRGKATSGL